MFKLKKITALVCAFILSCTSVQVFAAKKKETKAEDEDIPLYEKYAYAENFKYEDENIGYALQTATAKIVMNYSANVEYPTVRFNPDLLSDEMIALYEEQGDAYTSTEEFLEDFLAYAQENIESYMEFGDTKSVRISGTFVGSGVVIHEDGYIATNSHVVSLSQEDKLNLALSTLSDAVLEDIEDAQSALEEYDLYLDDYQLNELYYEAMSKMSSRATAKNEKSELEVWFPSSDSKKSPDDAIKYKATVVEEGTSVSASEEGLTQDTAILKIKAKGLVALKLSKNYPALNSEITAGGFPTVSDSIFQSIGSDESILAITITKGNVSKLTPIQGHEHQTISITAAISGGNSGGPSVDCHLDIEGLNTYTSTADQRYAYMVPAAYVSELAEDVNPKQGDVSKTFLLGLQMLQQGYGATALECFEYVQEMQPDTPCIKDVIEAAKNTTQNKAPVVEKKEVKTETKQPQAEPKKTKTFFTKTTIVILVASVAGVLLFVLILILILRARKRKKALAEEKEHTPTPPATTIPPIVPVPPIRPIQPNPAPTVAPVKPITPATPTQTPAVPKPETPAPTVKPPASPPTAEPKKTEYHPAFKPADDL